MVDPSTQKKEQAVGKLRYFVPHSFTYLYTFKKYNRNEDQSCRWGGGYYYGFY